ncbi:hypothetical protein [Actinophytocola sediminis]
MRKWITAGLLLVAMTGCGSAEPVDDSGKVASAGGTESESGSPTPKAGDDAGLQYTKCMRENGVDLPDPEPGKSPVVVDGPPDSKEHRALTACKQYLPDGGEPAQITPEELDQLRAYAKCMRDKGVEMPDPEPDGSMSGPAMTGADAEKLAAADQACQSLWPGNQ